MKLIAENLNEYILLERVFIVNEGLIDDFMKNTDKQIRSNIIKLMVGGMLSIPTGAYLNNIMSDDKVENKVTELVNDYDIKPEELVKQLNILANYVPIAMQDEANFLKDVRKGTKQVKNHDAVKRKQPSHIPSLEEISTYNVNDKDLLPNKIEKAIKQKGIPGYVNYLSWVKNRRYNAPNDGYINFKDIRMSNRGVHNLMKEESYRNYGYRAESKGNIVTVGYGTAFNPADYNSHGLKTPYRMGEVVPERKLIVYFYGKLQEFENAVGKVLRQGLQHNPNMRYMPQSAVDAVISYAYSTGPSGFKNSKLGKALSAGDIETAAYWIKNGNKSETGHTHRRNREYEMFTKNYNGTDWGKPQHKELRSAIDKNPVINIPAAKKVSASAPSKKPSNSKVTASAAPKSKVTKKTPTKPKSNIKKTNKKVNTNKKGVKK